jgi:hypothetical protein
MGLITKRKQKRQQCGQRESPGRHPKEKDTLFQQESQAIHDHMTARLLVPANRQRLREGGGFDDLLLGVDANRVSGH